MRTMAIYIVILNYVEFYDYDDGSYKDQTILITTRFDRAMHECKRRRGSLDYGLDGYLDESLRIEKITFDTEGIGYKEVIYETCNPRAVK